MTDADTEQGAWTRIAAERSFLLRLARTQLTCPADAEDAVQDALVSALLGWSTLRERTALRAWLAGILRHKITDLLRRRRLAPQPLPAGDDGDEPFGNGDAWHQAVCAAMADGERQLARRQLGRALDACVAELPSPAAQLVMLRDAIGMEMDELPWPGVTAGALRVQLHRARHKLRTCLLQRWGAPE